MMYVFIKIYFDRLIHFCRLFVRIPDKKSVQITPRYPNKIVSISSVFNRTMTKDDDHQSQ